LSWLQGILHDGKHGSLTDTIDVPANVKSSFASLD